MHQEEVEMKESHPFESTSARVDDILPLEIRTEIFFFYS